LSLGDKEISRSSPSPALEQPFRDRSNTLSEKPALPVIRDKYKDLTGEVEVSRIVFYRGVGKRPVEPGTQEKILSAFFWGNEGEKDTSHQIQNI
jgi:hypothetical protein